MGRHADPDTLALIERLKNKGKSLGFWVKDEYILKKNEYFVDLVWKINEEQDPFVTFEIETRDNKGVFSNTAKIFDTPSDYVTKPWFHFMIIHKSNLSEGHRKSLSRQISSYNIRLYESTFNDEEKLNHLENELETFAFNVIPHLNRYLENKTLGESLPEIIGAINQKLKDYPLKNLRLKWGFESDEPKIEYDDAIEFRLEHTTKRGEPILLDMMKEAMQKRMPLIINKPNLEVVGDRNGVFKEVKEFERIVIGLKNALPIMSLTVPSKSVNISDLVFSVIKNDEDIYCISTENRNNPYYFEFCIEKKSKHGKFKIGLDIDIASQEQTKNLESLMEEAKKEKQLILINTIKGDIFMKLPFESIKEK